MSRTYKLDMRNPMDRLTVESFARPVSSKEINRVLDAERNKLARKARVGRERYTIIDAGYPRSLYVIYDHKTKDIVREPSKGTHPWYTTASAAERAAKRLGEEATA